jgi:uncharacterized protein
MLFALTCIDKPGQGELRAATRPAHLDFLDGRGAQVVVAGPLLDARGEAVGSLLVIEAADEAAARDFAAADPYAKAGVFGETAVRAFRMTYRDGVRAA